MIEIPHDAGEFVLLANAFVGLHVGHTLLSNHLKRIRLKGVKRRIEGLPSGVAPRAPPRLIHRLLHLIALRISVDSSEARLLDIVLLRCRVAEEVLRECPRA